MAVNKTYTIKFCWHRSCRQRSCMGEQGGRGLAEELTLKLILDCVISRSREQNAVRVTGEATLGWAGRVC